MTTFIGFSLARISEHDMFKLFIVTYRNNRVLNDALKSLAASDIRKYHHEIIVINNDRDQELEWTADLNGLNLDTWSNCVRPPFSTGHLARNWNEAIINGIVDLDSPQCDYVICCQNDIIFKSNAFSEVKSHTRDFNFITYGAGDACCVHTPQSVKKVGLFDERFCNIGHQEGDYFIRQFLYNRDKCSLNDYCHHRVWNPLADTILEPTSTGYGRGEKTHIDSMKYHNISFNILIGKWTNNFGNLISQKASPDLQPLLPQFFMYPYFECKIENPEKRGYFKYA